MVHISFVIVSQDWIANLERFDGLAIDLRSGNKTVMSFINDHKVRREPLKSFGPWHRQGLNRGGDDPADSVRL